MRSKRHSVVVHFEFEEEVSAAQLPFLVVAAMAHPIMPRGHVRIGSVDPHPAEDRFVSTRWSAN